MAEVRFGGSVARSFGASVVRRFDVGSELRSFGGSEVRWFDVGSEVRRFEARSFGASEVRWLVDWFGCLMVFPDARLAVRSADTIIY